MLPRSLGWTTTVSVAIAGADERDHLLAPQHLLEHRLVERGEDEAVLLVLGQLEPAVARHGLGHVDEQGVGHGVAGVGEQRVDHLLGVDPRRAGVPQPERGEPVGVDVLGRPLQLGERRDRPPARRRVGVVDLEQQGPVGLDDQGAVGHRGQNSPAMPAVPSTMKNTT